MHALRNIAFFLCCLAAIETSFPAAAAGENTPGVDWLSLETGLDMTKVSLAVAAPSPFFPALQREALQPSVLSGYPEAQPPSVTAKVTLLRIDPAQFDFTLYMASEKGRKSLAEICKAEGFAAAINAGMFLPDGLTGTGYLRQGDHVNNGRLAANFGSFFMAAPLREGIPPARLMDRTAHEWEAALADYALVMQNYRMTTATGRVIWKPADRLHSVAALSQDARGNILFIFCSDPVPAVEFMNALLALPLDISSVMYLEGGIEAALVVNAGGVFTMQTGRHASGLWSGGANLEIPNVLGIRHKER